MRYSIMLIALSSHVAIGMDSNIVRDDKSSTTIRDDKRQPIKRSRKKLHQELKLLSQCIEQAEWLEQGFFHLNVLLARHLANQSAHDQSNSKNN